MVKTAACARHILSQVHRNYHFKDQKSLLSLHHTFTNCKCIKSLGWFSAVSYCQHSNSHGSLAACWVLTAQAARKYATGGNNPLAPPSAPPPRLPAAPPPPRPAAGEITISFPSKSASSFLAKCANIHCKARRNRLLVASRKVINSSANKTFY